MDLVNWTIRVVEAQGAGALDEQVAMALLIGASARGAGEHVFLVGIDRIDSRLRWPVGRYLECLRVASEEGWCTPPVVNDAGELRTALTLPEGVAS